MTVREIDAPIVKPDCILVDVSAASVNFPDLLLIADKYQISAPLPFTPGSEFAGTVAALGEGVTSVSIGDRVHGAVLTGAMAQQVLAPVDAVAPIPSGLSMMEAAAFRVTHVAAYHALVSAGNLEPGNWVVVLGAAGGVGTAATDIATRLGARVIAAASSPERLEVPRGLGAEAGVDYTREDLRVRIKQITGAGADLVIDPVGASWAEPALRALRWGGRFVTIGFAGGAIPRIPLNLVLLKNLTIRGVELKTWSERLTNETRMASNELNRLVSEGMRPLVSQVYELEDVAVAFRRAADRASTAKVVIRVDPKER